MSNKRNKYILRPFLTVLNEDIIARNKFSEGDYVCDDPEIVEVLSYYKITRDDAERVTEKEGE